MEESQTLEPLVATSEATARQGEQEQRWQDEHGASDDDDCRVKSVRQSDVRVVDVENVEELRRI